MICPSCLDKVLELLPKAVGKAVGLIPTFGIVAGPLAEAIAEALVKELQGKPPAAIVEAEYPDTGAVMAEFMNEGKPPVL